jgi:hypothetical protein
MAVTLLEVPRGSRGSLRWERRSLTARERRKAGGGPAGEEYGGVGGKFACGRRERSKRKMGYKGNEHAEL